MRIGIDAHSLGERKTGNETYTHNLVSHLAQLPANQHDYFVYLTDESAAGNLALPNPRFTKRLIRPASPLVRNALSFALESRQRKLDLLHVQYFLPLGVRGRTVLTVHDILFERYPQFYTKSQVRLFRSLIPWSCRHADMVITVSEASRREIVERYGINPDRVRAIHLAAPDSFHPMDPQAVRAELDERYGIGQEYLLFVGNIQPRKNLARLLAAFADLKRRGRLPHKLVIVGQTGWLFHDIFQIIKECKLEREVVFTGYVSANDLLRFYSAATAVVYPSICEGFGLPIVEAMACGAPVVTSRGTSLEEVAGDAAVLVDPFSVSEIAQAIEAVVSDPQRQAELRRRGLERSAGFRYAKLAQETVNVYERVLSADVSRAKRSHGAREISLPKPIARPAAMLFVNNSNDLYGADMVLLGLLTRLDRSEFRPIVALPEDTRHIGRFSQKLEEHGIEYRFLRMGVIRRKYSHPIGVLRYLLDLVVGVFALMRLINAERIDVVTSNTIPVICGALAAFLTRRPHVWQVLEILVDPPVARKFMHALAPRFSEFVVAGSQAVREHMLKDCPQFASRIVAVYNGIDAAKFRPMDTGGRIRREFGVPEHAMLVGMIGKVCRWKGQEVFLQAAKMVAQRCDSVRFLAVGGVFDDEFHYLEQFRQAVVDSGLEGKFHISDYRTDVVDIVNAFDVFVLPSTQPDPFPTVILEAMAAGKPVVATAHGGPKEMVEDGVTGLLVPPRDPRSMADAICQLIADPQRARAMGEAGRRRVSQLYTPEQFVHQFTGLYYRCLGWDGQSATAGVQVAAAGGTQR